MTDFTDKIESELLADRSLFSVYCNSDSYSETSFDLLVRCISGFFLVVFDIVIATHGEKILNKSVAAILNWSNISFTYSITILGFLVAGFTIFATMTKVEIFIALAEVTHKTERISQIKFIFYNFLRVFINHIILLFLSVFLLMGDDIWCIVRYLVPGLPFLIIKSSLVLFFLPILGFLLVNAILQLKTFVWNLYQSVAVAICGAVTLFESGRRINK